MNSEARTHRPVLFEPKTPSQIKRLSDKNLLHYLESDGILTPEGKVEAEKPLRTMLLWMKEEIFSILGTLKPKVDEPITEATVEEQIAKLRERFDSLYALFGAIKEYHTAVSFLKTKLEQFKGSRSRELKDEIVEYIVRYQTKFIKQLNTYLVKEKSKGYRNSSSVPFPLEIANLPFALLTATKLHLDLFHGYFHDLNTMVYVPKLNADMLLGSDEQEDIGITAGQDGWQEQDIVLNQNEVRTTSNEQLLDLLQLFQDKIINIVEFHDQYDLESLDDKDTLKPINDIRLHLAHEFPIPLNKIGHPAYNKTPFKLFFHDKSKEQLIALSGKETPKPGDVPDFSEFVSYLTKARGISIATNCKQNWDRINQNKTPDGKQPITEAVATLTYEFFDPAERATVKNQVIKDGRGVWVVLKIKDNGEGFPAKPTDTTEIIDGEEVVVTVLERGESTQQGEGIGLSTLKAKTEKANGIFKTYSSRSVPYAKGATVYISVPLLRVSTASA